VSAENVDLIRRIYDAWDREESARDFIAEDVEYVNPSYAVEPGTRRGRASFRVVRETYEDFRVHIEEILDAGGDDVLVLAHYTASGRGSGISLGASTHTSGPCATGRRCASSGSSRTRRPTRPPACRRRNKFAAAA
jgi:ketosteroid isomerase-like protein